jgi:hypothetical protein
MSLIYKIVGVMLILLDKKYDKKKLLWMCPDVIYLNL